MKQKRLVRLERRFRPRNDRAEDDEGAVAREREGNRPKVRAIVAAAAPHVDRGDSACQKHRLGEQPQIADIVATIARMQLAND